MESVRAKLTFANVVASLALFVAFGGGAYAATQMPKNSVGAKQLKKSAVTPAKLSKTSKSTLTGAAGPRVPAGGRGAAGATGPKGSQGIQGPPGNLSTNLPRDVTLRGRFDVDAVATGPLQGTRRQHLLRLRPCRNPPVPDRRNWKPRNPRAGPGWLCLYASTETNLELIGVGAYAFGADIVLTSISVGRYTFAGSWAVTGS